MYWRRRSLRTVRVPIGSRPYAEHHSMSLDFFAFVTADRANAGRASSTGAAAGTSGAGAGSAMGAGSAVGSSFTGSPAPVSGSTTDGAGAAARDAGSGGTWGVGSTAGASVTGSAALGSSAGGAPPTGARSFGAYFSS